MRENGKHEKLPFIFRQWKDGKWQNELWIHRRFWKSTFQVHRRLQGINWNVTRVRLTVWTYCKTRTNMKIS